jgi:hypothetical protein
MRGLRCAQTRAINSAFKGRDIPGQAIPTRLRTDPHMSRNRRVSLPIECSEANSDVIRVVCHPRKHWRPATGTKTSPGAARRLIFGYQIFSGNYTVSFKGNSRIGGKRCPVGSSAEVAVTKPNLPDRSNNLELEAATKAIAPDKLRQHGVLPWLADFSTLDYIS